MGKTGLIGIIIGFVGFSTYYCYAYFNYPDIPKEIGALNYVPIMLSLSLLSLELYFTSTGNKKKLFGFNSVFWGGVGIAYLFRDVLHMIHSKLFIILILGLWLIFGLVLYLLRRR